MVTKQIWCFWCCGCPTQFQVLDPLSVFSLDFFVFGRLFYSSVVMAPSMMMSLYLQLQLSQPLTAKQLQCLQSGELRAGPPLHQRLQVSLFTLPHSIWREMKHARPPVVNLGGGRWFSMWQWDLGSFLWRACLLLMYDLQQRTVGQSKETEGALQDLKGAEDALAFREKEQGEVEHHQHAQIRTAVC